jgi:hypothetical protein
MRLYSLLKYFLLFMNLTFATLQLALFLFHLQDGFSHWIFFHFAFGCFFVYMGVTQFRLHCQMEQHRRRLNENIDAIMTAFEELTVRTHALRMRDNVNWKRDGF